MRKTGRPIRTRPKRPRRNRGRPEATSMSGLRKWPQAISALMHSTWGIERQKPRLLSRRPGSGCASVAGRKRRRRLSAMKLRRRQLESRASLIDGGECDRAAPHTLDVVDHSSAAFEIEPSPIARAVVHQLQGAVIAHMRRGYARGAEVVFGAEHCLLQRRHVGLEDLDLPVAAGVEAE